MSIYKKINTKFSSGYSNEIYICTGIIQLSFACLQGTPYVTIVLWHLIPRSLVKLCLWLALFNITMDLICHLVKYWGGKTALMSMQTHFYCPISERECYNITWNHIIIMKRYRWSSLFFKEMDWKEEEINRKYDYCKFIPIEPKQWHVLGLFILPHLFKTTQVFTHPPTPHPPHPPPTRGQVPPVSCNLLLWWLQSCWRNNSLSGTSFHYKRLIWDQIFSCRIKYSSLPYIKCPFSWSLSLKEAPVDKMKQGEQEEQSIKLGWMGHLHILTQCPWERWM